ncbi:hypothetical protein FPV67DRAFT_600258 [Lyophyllum atratum]|nr:hypothetical protein FPV67DRAFT_600258 [Lyophyllum atratum]
MTHPHRRRHPLLSRYWIFGCLSVPAVLLFWCILQAQRSQSGVETIKLVDHPGDDATGPPTRLHAATTKIPPYSLTAVLPVTQATIAVLEESLMPLLEPSHLREIILLCPQSILSQARSVLQNVVSSESDYPDILLQTPASGLDYSIDIIHAASQVTTDWVLLMDHKGLAQETNRSRTILLHPPAMSVPFGPRGVCHSTQHISGPCTLVSDGTPQPASYLLPPFVIPTSLAVLHSRPAEMTADIWADLGEHIARSQPDGMGGVVFSSGANALSSSAELEKLEIERGFGGVSGSSPGIYNQSSAEMQSQNALSPTPRNSGVFVILLPEFEDLRRANLLLCMLQNRGHQIKTYIYQGLESESMDKEDRQFTSRHCHLAYTSVSLPSDTRQEQLLRWTRNLESPVDIFIALREEDQLANLFGDRWSTLSIGAALVRISREDLPHSTWMSSLSLIEWQNWNTPRLDISIITKNRPHSLARLLNSLSDGLFFGDSVNLRLNLEQSSDLETMRMAENISWAHGAVFVHHRIIQGGLLPAVVESWYPSSNDTYGLLLEDDVELSPLFYAWAKMSLLRYRYGDPHNRSPRMFGISLYQQKNVELPPGGRRPFNARNLFKDNGIRDTTTPYLSPIPCSWGAIYFPEHWREFHAYLSIRLSEYSLKIDQIIVPNVRSNNWTKSWKKYFIELVYLRGYVMLYPNYPDFVSLSTNHLEVGSHVKVRTKEKQDLFIVPLMQLPLASPLSPPTAGLLDLPHNTLPRWNDLPVLNLTGSLTTLEALAEVGHARRTELTGCTTSPTAFDIQDLMCIKHR